MITACHRGIDIALLQSGEGRGLIHAPTPPATIHRSGGVHAMKNRVCLHLFLAAGPNDRHARARAFKKTPTFSREMRQ
jgi:hypothetical protein